MAQDTWHSSNSMDTDKVLTKGDPVKGLAARGYQHIMKRNNIKWKKNRILLVLWYFS